MPQHRSAFVNKLLTNLRHPARSLERLEGMGADQPPPAFNKLDWRQISAHE